jgi:hypothetical protein
MLGDEMPRQWMETSGQEGRHYEVDQCPGTHGLQYQHVERDLYDKIGRVPPSRLLRSYKPRPQRVKENLEGPK